MIENHSDSTAGLSDHSDLEDIQIQKTEICFDKLEDIIKKSEERSSKGS